ncbi:MAG: TonB-dependent receptor [Tannerellaceae bacterium]
MKKITTFLFSKIPLLLLGLLISIPFSKAAGNSMEFQSAYVSIKLANVTMKTVFDHIEKQTDLVFIFNSSDADFKRKVSVNAEAKSVETVLGQILANNLDYKVDGKYITIYRKEAASLPRSQANRKIKGKVTDAMGAIIGANVVEKGATNGTITDMDGAFSLEVPAGAKIQISFIGYLPKEFVVTDQTEYNIVLVEDSKTLGEVVVVGYGVQKKENLTGAVSMVSMDKALGNRPVTNIASALQGTIPGLVVSSSAIPGKANTFNIRGTTSINGGGPLVLVDNVPADIDMINPEDIESVSVLKDAASAAIYGARGAFGVILITTKKAKRNSRLQLNYNNNFGFIKSINRPEQASIIDILETHKAWDNDGKYYADNQNLSDWIGYVKDYDANPSKYPANGLYMPEGENRYYYLKDNDPQGAILDNVGFQHTHNVSATGGGEKITYRISMGYTNNQGTLITNKDSYDRINMSSYLSADITPWLNESLDIRYANGKRSYVESDDAIYKTYLPRFYPAGEIVRSNDLQGPAYPVNTPENYIRLKDPTRYKNENPRIFSRTSLTPFKGFEAIFEYTFDKKSSDKKLYTSPFQMTNDQMGLLWSDTPSTGRYRNDKTSTDYNAINTYANYQFNLKNKHNFKAMVGYSQESRNYESLWVQRDDMINPGMPSISGATGDIQTKDEYKQYAIRSGFFRVNYDYMNRYLLEVNGRYDGSSKFPTDSRFGFFPSFSLGWQLGQEKFMEWSRSWLDQFKIRGSWGQVGNQAINEYAYNPIMTSKQAYWLVNGKKPITLNAPGLVRSDFGWEVVETLDVGFDFSAFNSRLNGTFDWYRRNTKGMLMPGAEFPSVVGTDAPQQNAADLRTKGWELSVSWRDQIGDWGYNVGFNLYDSRSVITKYDNEAGLFRDRNSERDGKNDEKSFKRYREGMTLGEIWGYTTDRYYTINDFQEGWQNGVWKLKDGVTTIKGNNNIRPGDIMFQNLRDDKENGSINQIDNGRDNIEDPGDRSIIGNETPRYQYGVTAGVNYKGFDLSIFLQGTGKRDAWLTGDLRFPLSHGSFGTVYSHQLDYWKPIDPAKGNWNPIDPNTEFPRLYDEGKNAGSNNRIQTKYLVNAAYLRLKNVTLGYTIPSELIKKISLSNIKVFFSAENICTWDKLPKGYDPERLSWGYPFYATYSFGINVTL